MASGPITSIMADRRGNSGSSEAFPLLGSLNHCGWWLQPWNRRHSFLWKKSYDKPRQCVEKQRPYSADKHPYSQGYGLPSCHIQFWKLDCKEGRAPKDWCLWTVVLEKTPESPLDSKEIKLVNLKGNQPWILIGRDWCWGWSWSSSILVTCRLTGEVPDAGKDWGQEKRASEDEMAGWHNWCNGRELGQTLGDGEGQGGLVCWSPWACKESDTTGWLNNKNNNNLKTRWPYLRGIQLQRASGE